MNSPDKKCGNCTHFLPTILPSKEAHKLRQHLGHIELPKSLRQQVELAIVRFSQGYPKFNEQYGVRVCMESINEIPSTALCANPDSFSPINKPFVL